MAFLTRYRVLRQADGTESDEVEYNFGRAFQQLGEEALLNAVLAHSYSRRRSSQSCGQAL